MWTKTESGFCSEASTLGMKPGVSPSSVNIKLPPHNNISFSWQKEYDEEGDLILWYTTVNCIKYEIFNT